MNNKQLALKLASAETEAEVIKILTSEGLWNDLSRWQPYGKNENNFSIIGNQQSNPDAALVEKLVNSVDAVLMKECMLRRIDPTSTEAPKSITAALEKFFYIQHGRIMTMDSKTRNTMSNSIILAATGKRRGEENIIIVDRGEGQSPKSMPETILSISRSNKLKVPFVQGKFNMGGTGALPFCGKNHLQLVISKRCPDITDGSDDDTTGEWSVTLVRKEDAREGRKSSMYTYLTGENKEILSFTAKSLPIIPEHEGKKYQDMEYGTYIKLFNYDMTGYKSNIILDFNYRLSLLLPNLAHPIRVRECRKGFSGHSFATTLSGMTTRLYDDRSGNVEDDFPSSDTFVIDGQELTCAIYLFKKGKQVNYRKREGVLFIVNGQTQAILPDNFFNKVNLSYLKDSLLVMVDCSKIDISHQESLFMTSRDRLRKGEFQKAIEKALENVLKNNKGLKEAEYIRRQEVVRDKLSEDKPLKDVLQSIMTKSPVLSKLFIAGTAIKSPFGGPSTTGQNEKFSGKIHPTYFRLIGMRKGKLTKHAPINHSFRVQFETDVQNDYFSRPEYPGYLVLKMDGAPRKDLKQSLNLFNGRATLTVSMPKDAVVGSTHVFETEIIDECIVDKLSNSFKVIIGPKQKYDGGGKGGGRKPSSGPDNSKKWKQNGFGMPEIIPVQKQEWNDREMNQYSAVHYYRTGEGGDYYLNMDNAYLLTELKSIRDRNKIELTKARFKYGMALVAMSVVGYYTNKKEDQNEEVDVEDQVSKITTMIAPVLTPMLESMADLKLQPANV